MATGGLYGQSVETVGLYGNNVSFGGTYFEWFIFQQSATQPATPTGGSWNFQTNVGTPPTGWSSTPPTTPTQIVWASIAIVSSIAGSTITWSSPSALPIRGATVYYRGTARRRPARRLRDLLRSFSPPHPRQRNGTAYINDTIAQELIMSSWAMVFIYKFLHELWSHNPEQRNHNFLGIKFLLNRENKTAIGMAVLPDTRRFLVLRSYRTSPC